MGNAHQGAGPRAVLRSVPFSLLLLARGSPQGEESQPCGGQGSWGPLFALEKARERGRTGKAEGDVSQVVFKQRVRRKMKLKLSRKSGEIAFPPSSLGPTVALVSLRTSRIPRPPAGLAGWGAFTPLCRRASPQHPHGRCILTVAASSWSLQTGPPGAMRSTARRERPLAKLPQASP